MCAAKSKRAPSAPGRKPAYQNTFAFKHNKGSKKTAHILGIAHRGLCQRCHEQIEWRKKYRKYKPLKQPRKCNGCDSRAIKRAYHTLCDSCAGARGVCAKCGRQPQRDPLSSGGNSGGEGSDAMSAENILIGRLRERDKRTVRRRLAAGDRIVEEEGKLLMRAAQEDAEMDEGAEIVVRNNEEDVT